MLFGASNALSNQQQQYIGSQQHSRYATSGSSSSIPQMFTSSTMQAPQQNSSGYASASDQLMAMVKGSGQQQQQQQQVQVQGQVQQQDTRPFSPADFPALGNGNGNIGSNAQQFQQQQQQRILQHQQQIAIGHQLGVVGAPPPQQQQQQQVISQQQQITRSPSFSLTDDFPALGGGPSAPKRTSTFTQTSYDKQFPSLGGGAPEPPAANGGNKGDNKQQQHQQQQLLQQQQQLLQQQQQQHVQQQHAIGRQFVQNQQHAAAQQQLQQQQQQQHQRHQHQHRGGSGGLSNAIGSPTPQQQQQAAAAAAAAGNSANGGSTSTAVAGGGAQPDRFGLLGLLSVIRMTNQDLSMLALGTDLTTLGLNLNSPESLHETFASPFSDKPARRDPEYHLPLCYYVPMQPAASKMSQFSDETLFYIFYSMPKDILQLAAARELYSRDWRYHKELQRWFTRVRGSEPQVKTHTYERGSYIYFEPRSWEKQRKSNFLLMYDKLEDAPPQDFPVSGTVQQFAAANQ
jgi:NOT2/NOT3/NOT5 C-terminal